MSEQTDASINPTAGKGLLFLGVLVVIGAFIAVFIIANRSVNGPLVIEAAPKPISVQTQAWVLQDRFVIEEKFTGLVTPKRTSQLGFTGGGRVDRLHVDIGARVRKGQVLANLDTRALRAQRASAAAIVAEAKAAYDLTLVTVERQQKLLSRGHVAKQTVDEANAQANTALARIAAAEANVEAITVQIDLARIVAPFAGTITQRFVDEGAIAGGGVPIFELVETEALEARIGLTAELSDSLELERVYTLQTDQGSFDAVLRSTTGVIDRAQRTIVSVFDILEPERVASGAVVRLALPQSVETRGVWLPVSALTESDRGLWSVYAARQSGDSWTAEPGLVEIIHQAGENVYVRGAIREGDQVILNGLQRITPGQAVTPITTKMAQSTLSSGE